MYSWKAGVLSGTSAAAISAVKSNALEEYSIGFWCKSSWEAADDDLS
jgi:hypothetical protein